MNVDIGSYVSIGLEQEAKALADQVKCSSMRYSGGRHDTCVYVDDVASAEYQCQDPHSLTKSWYVQLHVLQLTHM